MLKISSISSLNTCGGSIKQKNVHNQILINVFTKSNEMIENAVRRNNALHSYQIKIFRYRIYFK